MTTKLPDALTKLRDHQITLDLVDGDLVVQAPIEVITPELGAWLNKYKGHFTELFRTKPEYLSYPCPDCSWPLPKNYEGRPRSPQQCVACGEYSGIVDPVQTWCPDWPVDWPAR